MFYCSIFRNFDFDITHHKVFSQMDWAVHLHSEYSDEDRMDKVSTVSNSAKWIQDC